MYSQTIPITSEQKIELHVEGDLELHGWQKAEVTVTVVRENVLQINQSEGKVEIKSTDDLEIWVPEGMEILVQKVEGDAEIEDLSGLLTLRGVGGDLDLDRTGEAHVDAVGGDLDAKKVASLDVISVGGDCSVERIAGAVKVTNVAGDLDAEGLGALQLVNVGGDCTARHIESDFSVGNVGGDLRASDLVAQLSSVTVGGDLSLHVKGGGLKAMAGGDLHLSIDALSDQPVHLSAGGDVTLHLPVHASAKMHIGSGGRDILIRVGGWNERVQMFSFDFTLGEGATPVQIRAGGDVMVSDGDTEKNHTGVNSFEFGGVKVDVDAISQTVQSAVDKAARSAEIASHQIEERIQAAMRRVEEKSRERGIHVNFDGLSGAPATPPAPPAAPVPPETGRVSDDERKIILQMLADHKISAEEAMHLLDALEGKNR